MGKNMREKKKDFLEKKKWGEKMDKVKVVLHVLDASSNDDIVAEVAPRSSDEKNKDEEDVPQVLLVKSKESAGLKWAAFHASVEKGSVERTPVATVVDDKGERWRNTYLQIDHRVNSGDLTERGDLDFSRSGLLDCSRGVIEG